MRRVLFIVIGAAIVLGVTTPRVAGAQGTDVTLIPQENSLWCWAASAEMILDFLGSEESHSQAQQVARLYGSDGCDQTYCASGYETSQCNKTGFPQFYKYGFDAEVTRPSAAFAWPDLATELQCRPVAMAWENRDEEGRLTGTGHMVVLSESRTVSIQTDCCRWDLGPWIAVNDPASVRDRFTGECRANREVWPYGRYRRRDHWIHYHGFRPVGQQPAPCELDPSVEEEIGAASREAFTTFESFSPEDLVGTILAVFESARDGSNEDLRWLLRSAGLDESESVQCDVENPFVQEALAIESLRRAPDSSRLADLAFVTGGRRFLCTQDDDRHFSIELERVDSGAWQLASIGATATAQEIQSALEAVSADGFSDREVREVYVQGLNLRFLRVTGRNLDRRELDLVIPLSHGEELGRRGESKQEDDFLRLLRMAAKRGSFNGPS